MGRNIEKYEQTRHLVRQGIISPTQIIKQTGIKEWKTAKNYIDSAQKELISESKIDKEKELYLMLSSLGELLAEVITKMNEEKNMSCYIGLAKLRLKIHQQRSQLLQLDKNVAEDVQVIINDVNPYEYYREHCLTEALGKDNE